GGGLAGGAGAVRQGRRGVHRGGPATGGRGGGVRRGDVAAGAGGAADAAGALRRGRGGAGGQRDGRANAARGGRGAARRPDGGDVFAEVCGLLATERLLDDPRADGEGVAVCVVDSGVERAALEAKFNRAGRPIQRIEGGVFTAASAAPLPYDGRQSTPHGTTV